MEEMKVNTALVEEIGNFETTQVPHLLVKTAHVREIGNSETTQVPPQTSGAHQMQDQKSFCDSMTFTPPVTFHLSRETKNRCFKIIFKEHSTNFPQLLHPWSAFNGRVPCSLPIYMCENVIPAFFRYLHLTNKKTNDTIR